MKTLTIYNSKTGFTKQYAEWLSEMTGCSLLPYDKAKNVDFSGYDTIIFASWLHAGKIQKLDWFKKQNLDGKNQIVAVTGASPAGSPEVDTAINGHFKAFYLQGGLRYEKMSIGDRIMMSVFCKIVKKEDGEDSERYRQLSHSYDNSSRENLTPLVNYLNSL